MNMYLGKYLLLAILLFSFECISPIFSRAETQANEFDRFYYSYFMQPQPEHLNEALDYFVHVTGSAGTFNTEKDYRIFIQSRARFFSTLLDANPLMARHAESLFPQLFWVQKSLLLEIFKRAKDPGIKMALERWSHSEEDDDRRLLLEQTAIDLGSEDTWLTKSITTPTLLEEQWAFFFATGNTTVISNSFKYSSQIEAASDTVNANFGVRVSEKDRGSLQIQINNLLASYSLCFPTVRTALLELIQTLHPNQLVSKHEIIEMLAWRCLDTDDEVTGASLIPNLLILWEKKPEKLIYFQGAIAALRGQMSEVEIAIRKLETAEPLWADRLRSYQAHCQNSKLQSTSHWLELKTAEGSLGETRVLGNLKRIKSFRTFEQVTALPIITSQDETAFFWQQIQVITELGNSGWQQDGDHQMFWKRSGDRFYLWTEHQKQWVEVRNQQVRDRILTAGHLKKWIEFFTLHKPAKYSELQTPGGDVWIRLQYEPGVLEPDFSLGNELTVWRTRNLDRCQSVVSIDLNPAGGIMRFQINVGNLGEESIKIDKLYFDIQFDESSQ